jgi:glycosyltransferase involved in cell wall biosynthesis|uniref:Glycosyltransferase 2-like domain-containing protein n=1 Tax=viral metagenome TaxID=1070528 RepID=A0A6C0CAN0_9ZZZZ
MGKKNKDKKHCDLPFVSICTPTFNRRPFWEYTIKCFNHQDYPKDKMEWIIIDDGTDKIEDLVCNIEQVKYFYYSQKMPLGKKRNLMHSKSKGDIIVYMDDDDYYPPERVSHAVNMLVTHPNALCAGASEIYIWFKHIQKMFQFGPYGQSHATAGTFAFKRELLKDHKYEDHAALAEEKAFLKDYSVPFVQLEPKKTILVFSHIHNTFDKKRLLESGENQFQKTSDRTVDEFIKNKDFKEFYMDRLDGLLQNYYPGDPINKPDVIEQIKEIDAERRKMALEQQNQGQGQIILSQDGKQIPLSNEEVVGIMRKQQEQLQNFIRLLQEKDNVLAKLQRDLADYENMGNTYDNPNSNANSNKYKLQLEEETRRFSKVVQEKNILITKLEQEVTTYKRENEEKNNLITKLQQEVTTYKSEYEETDHSDEETDHSDEDKQSNKQSEEKSIQTCIENNNTVLVLEKELASCKNTIDKLNLLIDLLNKK